MENILLYLGLLIGGYLAGLLVNFFADWLYLRRKFYDSRFADELAEKGWIRYLTNPFSFTYGEQRFKVRSIIVDFVFIALVFILGAFPLDRVPLWWGIPVLIYFGVVMVMDVEFRIVMHPVSIAGAALGAIVGIYERGLVITSAGSGPSR